MVRWDLLHDSPERERVWRELHIENPLIRFRTLLDRNFRTCCIFIFLAYAVLYANTITLPELFQTLFGYDATTSGLVLSPSGVFAVVMLVVSGALLAKGADARVLMALGMVILAVGNFWLGHLDLNVDPWQVVWPRMVVIAGLSLSFAPLNVAAFIYLPKEIRPAAVGLLALQSLVDARNHQALSLAFFDVFTVLAGVSLLLALLVLMMRRSVAEKGERIGGE